MVRRSEFILTELERQYVKSGLSQLEKFLGRRLLALAKKTTSQRFVRVHILATRPRRRADEERHLWASGDEPPTAFHLAGCKYGHTAEAARVGVS